MIIEMPPTWGGTLSYQKPKGRNGYTVQVKLPHTTKRFHFYCTHYLQNCGKRMEDAFVKHIQKTISDGLSRCQDVTTRATSRETLRQVTQAITVQEVVEKYLDAKQNPPKKKGWSRKVAPREFRTNIARNCNAFAKKFGRATLLASITDEQIGGWIDETTNGVKKTKERRLCPIANMFEYATFFMGFTGPNVCKLVAFDDDAVVRSDEADYYSKGQFELLLKAGEEHKSGVMGDAIYLCRFLAQRLAGHVLLRKEHFDWNIENPRVWVTRPKTKGRGVVGKWVAPPKEFFVRFLRWKGQTGYCTPFTPTRKPPAAKVGIEVACGGCRKTISSGFMFCERCRLAANISKWGREVAKECGLYKDCVKSMHKLRHTFASENLIEHGSDKVDKISYEMGISNDMMRKHYASLMESDGNGANWQGASLGDLVDDADDQEQNTKTA